MPEEFPPLGRLNRDERRLVGGVRPRHLVLAAAVAGVAVTLAGLRAVTLPGPRPVLDSDRLRIQVVAPVEPAVIPGAVMEVGDLVDGYVYAPPPRSVREPAAYAPYDEAAELPDRRPPPQRYSRDVVLDVMPPPEPPAREQREARGSRWFGFDAPDRDYRAEREARRARREAREAQDREGRSVRWYRSDGEPVDDRRESRPGRDEGLRSDREY